MFQGAINDRVLMYEKQEQEKDYLSKLKHITGSSDLRIKWKLVRQ